jgi:hypothetical protein
MVIDDSRFSRAMELFFPCKKVAVSPLEVETCLKIRRTPLHEGKQIGMRFPMTFHPFQTIERINDAIETLG